MLSSPRCFPHCSRVFGLKQACKLRFLLFATSWQSCNVVGGNVRGSELPIECSGSGYRASGHNGAQLGPGQTGDGDRLAAKGFSTLFDLEEQSR